MLKTCTKCKILKDLHYFSKQKISKDGFKNICKKCQRLYDIEYRKKNKSKKIATAKTYYFENKEKIRKKSRLYRNENREKVYLLRKKSRARNKESIAKRYKNWKATKAGKISISNTSSKRRFLKKKHSDKTIPLNYCFPINGELKELLIIQKNKCYSCGDELKKGMHLDHHFPLSKGGSHSIDNVIWLCPHCNQTKGSKIPETLLLV